MDDDHVEDFCVQPKVQLDVHLEVQSRYIQRCRPINFLFSVIFAKTPIY